MCAIHSFGSIRTAGELRRMSIDRFVGGRRALLRAARPEPHVRAGHGLAAHRRRRQRGRAPARRDARGGGGGGGGGALLGTVRRWRAEALGLRNGFRPVAGLVKAGRVLHGWSGHLLPAPADRPAAARPTGFWTLPTGDAWTPPYRLVTYLEAGEPPVTRLRSRRSRTCEETRRTSAGSYGALPGSAGGLTSRPCRAGRGPRRRGTGRCAGSRTSSSGCSRCGGPPGLG